MMNMHTGLAGHYVSGLSIRPSVRPSRFRGTTLRAAPSKSMHYQQIIMHALQYQHNLYIHLLFCVDLDLHITSSRGRV